MTVFRGRELLYREALSPEPPHEEEFWGGDSGEEAASRREAPPPQAPSPEERLAFEVGRCFLVGSACECGRSPIDLVEVTAANRAAATMRRGAREKRRRKAVFFRGDFSLAPSADAHPKRLPPQREQSAVRLTEGTPLRVHRRALPAQFPLCVYVYRVLM